MCGKLVICFEIVLMTSTIVKLTCRFVMWLFFASSRRHARTRRRHVREPKFAVVGKSLLHFTP
jgi:hypothetical protein